MNYNFREDEKNSQFPNLMIQLNISKSQKIKLMIEYNLLGRNRSNYDRISRKRNRHRMWKPGRIGSTPTETGTNLFSGLEKRDDSTNFYFSTARRLIYHDFWSSNRSRSMEVGWIARSRDEDRDLDNHD